MSERNTAIRRGRGCGKTRTSFVVFVSTLPISDADKARVLAEEPCGRCGHDRDQHRHDGVGMCILTDIGCDRDCDAFVPLDSAPAGAADQP